ncbi:hypothetical protein AVEN_203135-1 [Araneus ventricosus]|uniref:Uncharacterized protein n=1 Tax=Araneus ventricosus TaxID=182803 RepID=A0A4Y2T285_ARAVE|nr:hypothetical protein AVEN_203135-1 [Araneus ventricosus]
MMVIVVDNYAPALRCYATEKQMSSKICPILTTKILKRLAESSIYDLNPFYPTPGRDRMDGLEATYCGADFVPQKNSGDEIIY